MRKCKGDTDESLPCHLLHQGHYAEANILLNLQSTTWSGRVLIQNLFEIIYYNY